ncbi:hypothetical protein WBJ53_32965 (plasmid) [Spirosoma sp. SC4-14]|uniref:hypothetical protein n=1 Tax=Spirosoma sp. SC4-14 TaxID=3128900 RepID=UPI0030D4A8B6
MKQVVILIGLVVAACHAKQERFLRKSAAFPKEYVGNWQAISTMGGPKKLQAGITIQPSGDSLLWHYFSQIVDTTTRQKTPCGPEMDFMPILWDDSLHVAKADHGVGQGYGYDYLRLTSAKQLQMKSFSLATYCRGPFGLNTTQLTFSKVETFRYKP